MSVLRRAAIALAMACATLAQAQPPADPGTKSVQIVRTSTAPVIDGRLDEAAWERAAVVDDLHQVTPVEYAEPFERTEVLLLYDDEALYIGARLYDTDPDEITARQLRQSGNIGDDDRFFVTIDPFNNRRSGYFFGVNPNGVRQDGLYRNVSEFYGDWDGIYFAEAGRFEEGWTAELEIPFNSISFDPGTDTWGINFSRSVVRKNEVIAWVSRDRAYNPSISGRAVGFEGLEQGIGLDVTPSLSMGEQREFTPHESDTRFEPSLDLVYKITPQLNGSLTVNTDFSATEVDDRQVNLTRFGLFFPEKRDFFLREADIFEFGGIGGQRQGGIPGFQALQQNGRPFFSRRIGLGNTGEIVDVEYGGKISGRVGNFELGALSIRQDADAGIAADNLSVMRAKMGVLDESNVGVIATAGDPRSNLDNSLAGVDFQYRNTRLPGGRSLEADLWYQGTDTEGVASNDSAYGFGLRIPTSRGFRGGIEYREFEENFNPALGFVNRRGVSDASGNIGYMHRPESSYVQQALTSLDLRRIEYLDGGLQTEVLFLRPFQLTNHTGDSLMMAYQDLTEVLREPFEISPGIVIPPGEYESNNTGIQLGTGAHRRVSARFRYVRYQDGEFFDGDRTDQFAELTWRPSEHFRANISYNYSEIELPQGDFETRLLRMGIDYIFNSAISLVNLIQYDNVTETVGINTRLHWIPQAGRELYFVINHGLEDPDRDNSFDSTASELTLKTSYTFRF